MRLLPRRIRRPRPLRHLVAWMTDDSAIDATPMPPVGTQTCRCPGGSISTDSYLDACAECGGRVTYMSPHPTDVARRTSVRT